MSREDFQKIRVEKDLDSVLLKYKGAIGVDVTHKQVNKQKTDKFGLTIYVKKKIPKKELSDKEAIPAEVEGIPTDVVECSNVWPSQEPMKVEGLEAKVQTPVLEGGLNISSQGNLGGFGTLGVVVLAQNIRYALSCAHVMVSSGSGVTGQGVIEPSGPNQGVWPDDLIGSVGVFNYGQNNIDAAITPISVGRPANEGSILNIGKISNFGAAVIGQPVRKMGARTGYTEGIVTSTTLTWTIQDHLGTITLTNQIQVANHGGTIFALPGDSGAVIIDAAFNMVGMVVAGDGQTFGVCNTAADLQKIIPT